MSPTSPSMLTGPCPTLPGPVYFVELTFMPSAPLPGPELPSAWVRVAEGRGPVWEDGREGGTPGEWPRAVIRFLPSNANPISQQGSSVLVQWDRAKRQCGWTP